MSRELLNRARRRSTHRQVRTERMAKAVNAALPDERASGRAFDVMLRPRRKHFFSDGARCLIIS